MKYAVAALVAAVLLVAAPAAQARSQAGGPGPLPPSPGSVWCRDASHVKGAAVHIPGFGEMIAACMHRHTMRGDVRNCLIATAVTLGGVAVGGVIGQAAARAIAGGLPPEYADNLVVAT